MSHIITGSVQFSCSVISDSLRPHELQDTRLPCLSPTPGAYSNASILWHSAFFIVQLSHPCITTGKTMALTRWTFVGKVMSLLFNMMFRLIIAFLPRSKCLLISWLQSPSAVILEPPQIISLSLFPHVFAMKWWDQMPWSSFSECWALSQLFHSP